MPYEASKVHAAVLAAMRAVGEEDSDLARDVAAVVELALGRDGFDVPSRRAGGDDDGAVASIEDVQDRVERALVEMGRASVAKAFILHRDRRARVREVLRVREEPPLGARAVRVLEADRTAPWSKARVAAALVAEADLPRELAAEVASRVETRVLDSGLQTVSTGLVRALVDNELVELGLVGALAAHQPVALPAADLRRAASGEAAAVWEPWLATAGEALPEPEALDPGGLERAAGAEVLRRFALREVLDARGAELHLAGDLHVEDLGRPHLPLTIGAPVDLLLGGPEAGAFALLGPLGRLLRQCSRGVALEELGPLLSELARATRPGSALGLAGWLAALEGLGAAAGRRVDLVSPGARFAAARARLIEELAGLPPEPCSPRLFVDESEFEALWAAEDEREALERLVVSGRLVPTWSRGDERFAGAGLRRGARERGLVACGGAVAINLPRLARTVGPWREERFLERLYELLLCAQAAVGSLARFQERRRPAGLRLRARYALVPVGLAEALRLLGDGETDPEQGARVLGLIADVAHRLPARGEPELTLSALHGSRASYRLAAADRHVGETEAPRQALLFAGASLDDGAGARPYAEGFALARTTGWRAGEAEAELVRTVPCGALHPLPGGPVHAGPGADTGAGEALRALHRFTVARAADPGAGGDDAFLPLEPRPARFRLVAGGTPDAEPTTSDT